MKIYLEYTGKKKNDKITVEHNKHKITVEYNKLGKYDSYEIGDWSLTAFNHKKDKNKKKGK